MAGRKATWALIFEGKVMNIIDCQDGYELANQLARACYGNEAFAIDVNQWTCNIGDIYRNGGFYYIDAETKQEVPYERLLTDEEELLLLKTETAEIREIISPTIDITTCSIDELKAWDINLSNEYLAKYLQEHPLISDCHGGKPGIYTITKEKQNLFTSKFTAHSALTSAGIADVMTWNEAGKECEIWTTTECIRFISEWNAISTSLVTCQQRIELEIKDAKTKEEILAIDMDYAKADPRTPG